MVKCLAAMWETRVRSLGQEDSPEKEMANHSSTLGWKIGGGTWQEGGTWQATVYGVSESDPTEQLLFLSLPIVIYETTMLIVTIQIRSQECSNTKTRKHVMRNVRMW